MEENQNNNAIYGDAEIYFGEGKVLISPMVNEFDDEEKTKIGLLLFSELDKPLNIGDSIIPIKEEILTRDYKVRFVFSNVESINVLIEQLQTLKEDLKNS